MKSPSITDETSAEDLFTQMSVYELRGLERKTRAEIEEKKQELRSMVGEQYRDLISAADAIVSMKKAAHAVQSKFDLMQVACDVDTIHQKTTKIKPGNDSGEDNEKKRYLYVSAAQMKLLVDVPEQIWHALENDLYLEASRLFLLAKMVYKNLQIEEDVPFVVINTFPVVQKQWDAISQFKLHIIQRAENHLKNTSCGAQVVTESLLSLMMLDDATLKDSFQKLLSMRMAALTATVEVPKSKTTNTSQPKAHIMQQLHGAVQLIKQVITQVWSIFILKTSSLDQPSHTMPKDTELSDNFISSYVRQLQRTFSIQPIENADQLYLQSLGIGSPASCTQPAISRIYSPNTNVHLLVRYLPESIQKYTPYINLFGEDRDAMRLESVQQDVSHWLKMSTDLLTEKIAQLLTECADIKTLLDVRQSVWEALIDDEVATNSQATVANDSHVWVSACRALFGKPLSIWHTILKAPFNQRLEALIDERTKLIKSQADVLSDYLAENLKEYANESDLGSYIWSSQPKAKEHGRRGEQQSAYGFVLPPITSTIDIAKLKQNVKNCASCYPPTCRKMQESFDKAIRNTLSDYQSIGAALDTFTEKTDMPSSTITSLFSCSKDTQYYLKYHHGKCITAVTEYVERTLEMLSSFSKEAIESDQDGARSQVIFLGRLARCIGLSSEDLLIAFTHKTPHNGLQYTLGLDSYADRVQAYLDTQNKFISIYHAANELWSEYCAAEFGRKLIHMLEVEQWNELNTTAVLWQTMQNAGDAEGMRLPAYATNALIEALLAVCKEIHSAHSGTLDETSVNMLCSKLLETTKVNYETMLAEFLADENKLTEKGALQLLFDLQFLSKLLQSSTGSDPLKTVLNQVKSKIDPINMRVFQPFITTNIERNYSKCAVMLGLLFPSSRRPASITRKHASSTSELPNILPAAEQVPRFALLPIGHQTSSILHRY
ncbi:hypothetical protein K450DRAFT_246858 [Umbelopsis ramanniana AG]|uniref:Conserved oligomeric Golgi complex subunit 1 n=1 Tax=Umbelopsis ramanniana AG TaxID=1314678 RepID=A0AAD5HBW7_UMBRA|nr:uncharacterized protein K450DRAFT_246858 [Umbelopsis ramanniana AG]KAI8578447.1 hypothetical protein K450DRAFT_246858 [Umbelopsis ramanniana AG]